MHSLEKNPLVSCIIIFFNPFEHGFFKEAIGSILDQTYPNIELILVDDGSTDGSTDYTKTLAKQHPDKIKYFNHDNHLNLGMSATRNLGIDKSSGQLVAFLDSDDYWSPEKISNQVMILQKYPEIAMLFGRTRYSFENDNNEDGVYDISRFTSPSKIYNKIIKPPYQLKLYLTNSNYFPCTCSSIYRRECLLSVGGAEDEFFDAYEDQVLNSKIFSIYAVMCITECWDVYRIHENSFWRKSANQDSSYKTYVNGRLKYLSWINKYLSKNNLYTVSLRNARIQGLARLFLLVFRYNAFKPIRYIRKKILTVF